MDKIQVKAEYKNTVFGFNNSTVPLGYRDDLHLLIINAKAKKQQYILDMFEEVPTDEELQQIKASQFLKKHQVNETQTSTTTNSNADGASTQNISGKDNTVGKDKPEK